MKIRDIYLKAERVNPVTQATIPAAWMVEYENGKAVPVCSFWDAKNPSEVRAILEHQGEAA